MGILPPLLLCYVPLHGNSPVVLSRSYISKTMKSNPAKYDNWIDLLSRTTRGLLSAYHPGLMSLEESFNWANDLIRWLSHCVTEPTEWDTSPMNTSQIICSLSMEWINMSEIYSKLCTLRKDYETQNNIRVGKIEVGIKMITIMYTGLQMYYREWHLRW